MDSKKVKWIKGFILFLIILITFCLGEFCGKAYVLRFQKIHKTDSGYSVVVDLKEYHYLEDM